jgi:hypothetical protein
MAEPTSLAEFLGASDPPSAPSEARLEDITDPRAFGEAILLSREFRSYILDGLRFGQTPGFSGILKFFLEHTLGKPPDKLELTGKDGAPIETVTEVRRVIVRRSMHDEQQPYDEDRPTEAVH